MKLQIFTQKQTVKRLLFTAAAEKTPMLKLPAFSMSDLL